MLKAAQPKPFLGGGMETNPCDLIAELHAFIHPTESDFGIGGTRWTYDLAHQVQIVHHGHVRAQEFVERRAQEGLTKGFNGLLYRADGFSITAIESATHTTVMGKRILSPSACNDRVWYERVRTVIQVGQILDAAQDACQELNHFGLGCKRDSLLRNRHLHQFLAQSVLL